MADRYDDDGRLDRIEQEGQEVEPKKKKKKFNLFDSQREGKGVSKNEKKYPPDLRGFWQSYRRNFSRLLSVNILMVLGNFPIIFFIASQAEFSKIPYAQPISIMNQVLESIHLADTIPSPATLALMTVDGLQQIGYAYTPLTFTLLGLSALLFLTFGITNVGVTYILRNLISGDPVFVVSDFFYAIKRNYKQALPFGILDLILVFLIPFNIYNMLQSSGGYFPGVMLWANIIFGLIYFFMRFYIYLQMVTFDLSVLKILKNSLIFVFLGFKRNITAFLGILILSGLNVLLLFFTPTMGIGVILPFVLTVANCMFMSAYAAYFKMKELMIDPYVKQEESADTSLPSLGL